MYFKERLQQKGNENTIIYKILAQLLIIKVEKIVLRHLWFRVLKEK